MIESTYLSVQSNPHLRNLTTVISVFHVESYQIPQYRRLQVTPAVNGHHDRVPLSAFQVLEDAFRIRKHGQRGISGIPGQD